MKNLNKAILIALGMTLPLTVMASPDDDVTIRMMEANEHAIDAVTSHIELPDVADDHAREHAAEGLETANKNRDGEHDGMDGSEGRDHEMEREEDHERDMDNEQEHEREMDREDEREREMDREDEHERDMETERDDRKDVEHEGVDREEIEREGIDNIDHGDNNMQPEPEIEAPDNRNDNDQSSHGPQ